MPTIWNGYDTISIFVINTSSAHGSRLECWQKNVSTTAACQECRPNPVVSPLFHGFVNEQKRAFLEQVIEIDAGYPGGLKAYQANANSYVVKPSDLDGIERILNSLSGFWFGAAKMPSKEA